MRCFFLLFLVSCAVRAQPVYEFKTFAGGKDGFQDGDRKNALLRSPEGIAADAKGNLYITEYRSSIVRKITPDGVVSLLAGQPMKTGYADGPGREALFDRPHGLVVDKRGNVYICDMKNHLIRKISPKGIVSTLAGKAGEAGTTDGVGEAARFQQPEGVALDSRGNLYVADTYNFTIRKIDKKGRVSTLAGKGGEAGYADGKRSQARFNMPLGLAIDAQDNIYVADANYDGQPSGNCLIRKIDLKGNVSTFAGVPGQEGNRDGKATEALFHRPVGIAAASDGTVFVADTEADLIRMIDQKGNVTTIGGQYLQERALDGIGSQAAFFDPQSITVAPNGDLYLTDTLNNRIVVGRKIRD